MEDNKPPELYYVGILKTSDAKAHELCMVKSEGHKDLKFGQRYVFSQFVLAMIEAMKITSKRTKPQSEKSNATMPLSDKELKEQTEESGRETVKWNKENEFIHFHFYKPKESLCKGICGVVISNNTYPLFVAHELLSKVVNEFITKFPREKWAESKPTFTWPELQGYFTEYKEPAKVNSIVKINKELADTKRVITKTIDSLLERGEKIDTLVAKSDELSAQSKMFYTQAKKQNSCCSIM